MGKFPSQDKRQIRMWELRNAYSLGAHGFPARSKAIYLGGPYKPVASSITTRSKNVLYCCWGDMVSKGDGGVEYGSRGLQKQIGDVTHRNMLGNESRNGNGDDQLHDMPAENKVTCTTFNVLAPIYKRIDTEGTRESSNRKWWVNRNKGIVDILLLKRSSIICLQSKLQESGLNNSEAFGFFKSEQGFKDYFTLKEFGHALHKLGLTEQLLEGLTDNEIEDLMIAADIDGNGIIDDEEFQKAMLEQSIELSPITVIEGNIDASKKCSALNFNGKSEPQVMQYHGRSMTKEHKNHTLLKQIQNLEPRAPLNELDVNTNLQDQNNLQESEIGFDVIDASFFPSEVGQAIWPDDYLMSDHAVLNAVFEPVRIPSKEKVGISPQGFSCKVVSLNM